MYVFLHCKKNAEIEKLPENENRFTIFQFRTKCTFLNVFSLFGNHKPQTTQSPNHIIDDCLTQPSNHHQIKSNHSIHPTPSK